MHGGASSVGDGGSAMTAGTYSGSATTATTATTVLTVLPLDMQVAWWSPAAPWIGTICGPHYRAVQYTQCETSGRVTGRGGAGGATARLLSQK